VLNVHNLLNVYQALNADKEDATFLQPLRITTRIWIWHG